MAKHIFANSVKHDKTQYKKGQLVDEKMMDEKALAHLKKHGHIVEATEKLVEVEEPKKGKKE